MTAPLFSALPLSPAMLANLAALGYVSMTPVQAESLPHLLAGRDVIAQAMTGSGKTAAFGIGVLHHLDPHRLAVQALVLCPTRELAEQLAKALRQLARCVGNTRIITLCGGTPMGPQLGSLEHGAHIVVGTPGRVLKHVQKGSLKLDSLSALVLDEADRMLDMGFHDSIVEVIGHAPPGRQTLLFSATWPEAIRALSRRYQREPVTVTVESLPAPAQVDQRFFEVDPQARMPALVALLRHYLPAGPPPASAIVFCNTKQACDEITRSLRGQGFHALALHGDLEQRERDQVLVQFSNHSCPLLVATDVAARGLDIKDLTAVIHAELAFDAATHVHRSGRTGRAGQRGLVLSLCVPAEMPRANAIEDALQQKLVWCPVPADNGQPVPPPAMVTLQIGAGRKDKLRPGDILGALTGEAGIPAAQVGRITLSDLQAYVAVDYRIAREALARLQQVKIKGRAFRVRALPC